MASLMMVMAVAAHAQCAFHNDAFKSGEFLTYNLYYNWQFVWVKAGNASMSTVQSRYNGHPAYRASLTTRGNNRVDQMFVLRDTLLCYSSLDMEPLYFRKGAREGKRYGVDEIRIEVLLASDLFKDRALRECFGCAREGTQHKDAERFSELLRV